jgi:hypothetical protein
MAAQQKVAETVEAPRTVKIVVAPRRTVVQDSKAHGPGTILHVSETDAAMLRAAGFIVSGDAPSANTISTDRSVIRPR